MRRIILLAMLTISMFGVQTATADSMYGDEYLYADQSLSAPSCYYHLDMQSDGNLVIYANPGRHHPVWATDTVGRGAYAVMQQDGNLVVYDWSNAPVWASGTHGNWGAKLTMQDDGNLVVYTPHGPVWASDTAGESIGQSPCGTETSITVVERDFDRFGGDYVYYEIDYNWPEACEYWCSQDFRCQAFTYVPAGMQGPKARCWLKDTVPPLSYGPGLVSGYILRD